MLVSLGGVALTLPRPYATLPALTVVGRIRLYYCRCHQLARREACMYQFLHRYSTIRRCVLAGLLLASTHSFAADLFTDGFESANMSHTENSVKWGSGAYTSVVTTIAH